MENKEKLLEDLKYMKQFVQESRTVIVDNGIGFIMWGIIIILGLIGSYVDSTLAGDQYSSEIWIALISGGWIYSLIKWFLSRGEIKRVTFAGRIMGSTWFSAGVSMTIIGFIGSMTEAYHSVYIAPIIAAILGIAFYLTAQVTESKMLKYVTPLWWVGSIFMFLDPGLHTLIIMAAMMLFLQVVPGIVFFMKYKSVRINNG